MNNLARELMAGYNGNEGDWFGPDNWGSWAMVTGEYILTAVPDMRGTDIQGAAWWVSIAGAGKHFASSWNDTSEGKIGYPDVEAAKAACLNYFNRHVAVR